MGELQGFGELSSLLEQLTQVAERIGFGGPISYAGGNGRCFPEEQVRSRAKRLLVRLRRRVLRHSWGFGGHHVSRLEANAPGTRNRSRIQLSQEDTLRQDLGTKVLIAQC